MSDANDELKLGWKVEALGRVARSLSEREHTDHWRDQAAIMEYERDEARTDLAATRARLAEADVLIQEAHAGWEADTKRLAEAVGLLASLSRRVETPYLEDINRFLARYRAAQEASK